MKVIFSTLLLVSFVSAQAAEFTGVVKCSIPGKHEKQETVHLKMVNGTLIQWDEDHVARPDAKSLFGLLSEAIGEGPIESVKFGRGKNGYAMVSVYTTADALTIGVSPDLKTGFYKYQDIGSGNGNESFVLKCEPAR